MDLNTALRTALDGWKSDDINTDGTPPMHFTETTTYAPASTSITQQTFDHIKANPGIKIKNAVNELQVRGLKPSTTMSLISQMVRNGLLSKVDHCLTAQVKQYRSPVAMKKSKHVRITVKGKDINPPLGGIATLTNKPDVAYNITSLLDNISVNEARALYLELKSMFGGN